MPYPLVATWQECTDALLSLNVGVPRKWIDHLVNVADYDRDGEINYQVPPPPAHPPHSPLSPSKPLPSPLPPQEFARILTCDDITKFKKAGAEEEGLVDKSEAQWYNKEKGLTFKEMKMAQTKMRDMLHDRGE